MFKAEEVWDESEFPLAYLITIRTYGTWLHGDSRGSVDVHRYKNIYGAPKISSNKNLQAVMKSNMTQRAFTLHKGHRPLVEEAIAEVCKTKNFFLHAVNARSNHVHTVVTAQMKPEPVAELFKKYATRKLRESGKISKDRKVWSRGRSRDYLWKDEHLTAAMDYVLYGQGGLPFEIDLN